MKKILFVCHGNICRSPMAEFLMKDMAKREGLDVYIESAATSTEEIGNGVHYGTRRKLAEYGISCDGKRARQMTKRDYDEFDYIIGMDSWNIRNINRIIGADTHHKVYKLLEFAGENGDIADPWYTHNFDETYDDIIRGLNGLKEELR
ncbi:MAG: low molecular weight phosphotyrosine protein phosphatase [Clostridia bacterium]|nr:low molecular weight phosphotyrosine protein phosphatase [Clostridia bacterium]MBQ3463362.1 low molecular weight phosphotyrosine protein phosphatase [Clostridia bacterium]MBQ6530744.1 low molecular weight phosphotyrosine protein phosphatase [Clostridia bacterium]MBR0089989.1 low molecular weight phosphotyrosine protein phosphatase [Clostridia bacterium]